MTINIANTEYPDIFKVQFLKKFLWWKFYWTKWKIRAESADEIIKAMLEVAEEKGLKVVKL